MQWTSRLLSIATWSLALGALGLAASCAPSAAPAEAPLSLEIRFQADDASAGVAGPRARTAAALAPTEHDQVTRVLIDVTRVEGNVPIYVNFDLTEVTADDWRGSLPSVPRDQQLRFNARALDAAGNLAFSGQTLATLATDNQALQIPLAPAQDQQTFPMPRMTRIVYPSVMFSGQEEQVAFTVQGSAGAALSLRISPAATPATLAPELSPAAGTVTLTGTVADFVAVYTPPTVTTETTYNYRVTVTTTGGESAVAVSTAFSVVVRPAAPGGDNVSGAQPRVVFNPVIRSLTASAGAVAGSVDLTADVRDDDGPAQLTYQWSFAPAPSTPAATFANDGASNPAVLEGYTLSHQGVISLAVSDGDGGTTTLRYPLVPNQFADAIDHGSVTGISRIVAGGNHTCALTGEGRVRCWGANTYGQLGYGNTFNVGDSPTNLPFHAGDVPLPPLDPVTQLAAGFGHTCALLRSGLVVCWGANYSGQLGYGHTNGLGDGEPVTSFGYVTLGGLATHIAAGGDHTCAILQSGALRCWGDNTFGQLGRGNTDNVGDDETVASAGNVSLGAGVVVRDVALGAYHSCAILGTGDLRCWGVNTTGHLGYGHTESIGDNESLNELSSISLTGAVRKVVAGFYYTCALLMNGTLRCWGDNSSEQLGQYVGGHFNERWGDQPNELPSSLPHDIAIAASITEVAAGYSHVCAQSADGQLRCWGNAHSGQLGDGGIYDHLPTPPTAGVDLDGVSAYRFTAGSDHTCALRSNGTVRCWGNGASGKLGRGSTASSATATGNVDVQIFAP